MVKAKIEEDKDGKGLWLVVESEDESATAFPITKDEVQPIMQACIDFLVNSKK